MNRFLLSTVFILMSLFSIAQEKEYTIGDDTEGNDSLIFIKVGSQIPYQINIDLAYNFSSRISGELEFGFINPSFASRILDGYDAMGMPADVSSLINSFFKNGQVIGIGMNYRFKNESYLKGMFQMVDMTANLIDMDLLESVEGVSFADIEQTNSDGELVPMQLFVKNRLYNAAVFYGRRILPLSERLNINAEIGFIKTLGANNFFWARNYRNVNLDRMEEVNKSLNNSFRQFGFIPTLNIYLHYRLKTCDCN